MKYFPKFDDSYSIKELSKPCIENEELKKLHEKTCEKFLETMETIFDKRAEILDAIASDAMMDGSDVIIEESFEPVIDGNNKYSSHLKLLIKKILTLLLASLFILVSINLLLLVN